METKDINEIDKNVDVNKDARYDGIGEVGFPFESDLEWFTEGMAYISERSGVPFITSDWFWRNNEVIMRIVVGESNLEKWEVS